MTRADLPGLDILDLAQCVDQVAGHDVVVNSAAYRSSTPPRPTRRAPSPSTRSAPPTWRGRGTRGAAMVELSTDYVVAGEDRDPYPAEHPGRTRHRLAAPKGPASGRSAECPQLGGAHGMALRGQRHEVSGHDAAARGGRDRLTVVADQVGQPDVDRRTRRGAAAHRRRGRAVRQLARHRGGGVLVVDLARAVSRSSGSTPIGSRRSRPTSSRCRRPADLQRASRTTCGMRRTAPLRTGATPCIAPALVLGT